MEILDGHTHIASTRYLPPAFLDGVIDNMLEQMRLSPIAVGRNKIEAQLLALYDDHKAERQIAEMDRLGFAQALVLLPDFTYALKGGLLTIAEMYREHATILAQHPGRFFVFAGPDPRWGRDGFDLFVKGIEEYGFTGLKIYPPCGYRPNADVLKPFYEYCNEHSLPVLMHTGPTSPVLSFTEAHPSYVDEPARKYENISFILAHGAANYQEECINLCRYRRNVYLDLSGAQQLALDARSAPEFVRVFTKGINHKVIFGTDWPINHHPHLNRKFVEMLWKPGQANGYLSERDAELVLGGNLRHILSLSKLKRSAADHSAASNGAPRSVEATPS